MFIHLKNFLACFACILQEGIGVITKNQMFFKKLTENLLWYISSNIKVGIRRNSFLIVDDLI